VTGTDRKGEKKKKTETVCVSVRTLTYRRARRLVRVGLALLVERHRDGRQDHDLIPGHEDGPREGLEGAALELKRHGASAIDKDVEPDQST